MGASTLNKAPLEEKVSKYDGLLAKFYDLDHHWRDYKKQTGLIKSLYPIQRSRQKIRILDMCCGSGTHSILLSQEGFEVLGVDQSSLLIKQARIKSKKEKVFPIFKQGDIFKLKEDSSLHQYFDCALLLGWTLSIQSLYERLTKILELAHALLNKNGFFIFDIILNKNFNSNSTQPLLYKTEDGTRGALRVKSKENKAKGTMNFEYQWKIKRRDGDNEQFFLVNEVLTIVNRDDVFLKVDHFKSRFEKKYELSDYSLDSIYKKGDKNLVMILRKRGGG